MKINTFSYPPDMKVPDKATMRRLWAEYCATHERGEAVILVDRRLYAKMKAYWEKAPPPDGGVDGSKGETE